MQKSYFGKEDGVSSPKIQLGKDAEDQGQGPQFVAGVEHEPDVLLSSIDRGD